MNESRSHDGILFFYRSKKVILKKKLEIFEHFYISEIWDFEKSELRHSLSPGDSPHQQSARPPVPGVIMSGAGQGIRKIAQPSFRKPNCEYFEFLRFYKILKIFRFLDTFDFVDLGISGFPENSRIVNLSWPGACYLQSDGSPSS